MIKRLSIFLSAFFVLFMILSNVYAAEPFGTNLGDFNGITAYSNGSSSYYSGQSNYVNGTYTGVKWQCVEYVRRYYFEVYNLDLASMYLGNANTWYNNASTMGLDAYPNGGSTAPQVGDILVSNGGGYGHVAIVRSVTNNQVCTAQQNFSNDLNDLNRCLALTVSNGNYTVDGFDTNYPIQGWLRYHLNDGLVAYYPFNGNANDESGNGNNGTVYGATLTTNRFGFANSAYSFDGVNDYIHVPYNTTLAPASYTVVVWYKADSYKVGEIITKGIDKHYYQIQFQSIKTPYKNTIEFWYEDGYDNDYYILSSNGYEVGNYFMATMIFDNYELSAYINGSLIERKIFSARPYDNYDGLYIGKGNDSYFHGVIDDIRIYNRALTDSEIMALYNGSCIDNDGDGYGNPGDASCPGGNAIDCNDNDPTVNPGATEGPYGNPTCSDLKDNDCDGLIDAADPGCQAPDLLVSTWTAPANACAGATISIKDTTKNQGSGLAGASTTKFYLSTNTTLDAGDTPLGSRTVPSLTTGAVNTGTTPVNLPNVSTGKYYIIVMADDGKAVTESNETNNKKTKVIYIGPDLIVSAFTAPTSATVGTPFSVKVTTKNKGCGSTVNTSYTKVYLTSGSASGLPQSLTVPPLGTGATNTQTIIVTISTPGTYYINAQADSTNTVVEASETNNKKSRKIVIY